MAQERRRWSRVDCDTSTQGVLLRLETQDPQDPVLNTMARDISVGGLSFEVNKSITLPDPLSLKLFLPHAHTPLDCSSRIAWQKMNEQTTRIGVAFPQLSEEGQHTLEGFLREVGSASATVEVEPTEVEEAKPPSPRRGSRRDQAVFQFEQGVLLYHQRKFGLAKREFQKVLKEYADVIDVVRVARRYHDWCEEEKGGIAHG